MFGQVLTLDDGLAIAVPHRDDRPARVASSPAGRRDQAHFGGPLPPDETARFRRTFLPHMDAAFGFARYLSRDATVAEDLVQEAYPSAR
jgi:hypothetical protein